MANISAFTVIAYQRKPSLWRAAVSRKDGKPLDINGEKLKSFVTQDDCPSEEEAIRAGQKAVSRI